RRGEGLWSDSGGEQEGKQAEERIMAKNIHGACCGLTWLHGGATLQLANGLAGGGALHGLSFITLKSSHEQVAGAAVEGKQANLEVHLPPNRRAGRDRKENSATPPLTGDSDAGQNRAAAQALQATQWLAQDHPRH